MNKILELINEILGCVNHIKDLKMAVNSDMVILSFKDKVYIYFRITEKLVESPWSFEEIYNQYFY